MTRRNSAIAQALASILHKGLLSLRGTAGRDARYVEAEANHLHNLPFCIVRLQWEDIAYYYQMERPRYLAALGRIGARTRRLVPGYDDEWAIIATCLRRHEEHGAH